MKHFKSLQISINSLGERDSTMENKIRKRQNNGKQRDINCGLQNGSMQIKSDKSCYCRSSNNLHEFNCHFVPKHLKFNEYVHTGYRVDLSTWKCLKSLFYLHNESFNVYSHGRYRIFLIQFTGANI